MTAHPSAPARATLSLDGPWEFRHESDGAWREARVPLAWQCQFPDLAWSHGTAIYRRRLDVPAEWAGREVALRFGAVSDRAVVRLDGAEIGRHEGGYLPFEVVLPDGAGRLLEVEAHLPAERAGDGFAETPHGKQSWYGPQGGIWQSVTLEARHAAHVASLRLDPHWPEGRLDLTATLSRPVEGSLAVEVRDPSGAVVHAEAVPVSGGIVRHALTVPDVAPWSPDAPALYTLHATLSVGGEAVDAARETFGFRRIEARGGCLHLNGQPLYLRGALDQDYYPDGSGTAPSLEMLEDQARKAKAMGLNCLRVHIKVPDPRYHEVADRLGLIVWAEIPNVETFTVASAARLRATMEGILARDRNHPSICVWTLINEDWGTRLREVADQRTWIVGMVDWLRAEDPLRLVVDNSACFPNKHVKADINDYHYYRTLLERRTEWAALTAEFAAGADWTFERTPEAVRTGDEPLIVSEFGVWGLPDPALLRDDGRDPWWMPFGSSWAEGTALPQGIEARFGELGLGEVWGTFDAFIAAAQDYQWENLKAEIEEMRRYPSIAGYVVTELTDVHWEGNGLMDMARNPRPFAKALAKVNTNVVIAPGARNFAARAGDAVPFDLAVATGGASLPEGARLRWHLGDATGEEALSAAGPMSAAPLPLVLPAPRLDAPARVTATFAVVAPDGTVLAENDQTITVLPPRAPPRPLRFATDDDAWAERLTLLGHKPARVPEADLVVTDALDAPAVEAIHAGARVLQLAGHGQRRLRDDTPARDGPFSLQIEEFGGGLRSGPYFSFPGYRLVNRHHGIWRGDWVGNFSWLRRDGAFAGLPGGPMLDLSFERVVPHHVLTGLRAWEFRGRVHAGVVVGWVHKPGAFVVEKRLGAGKLVLTTFRLDRDAACADPVATALLDGLVSLTMAP